MGNQPFPSVCYSVSVRKRLSNVMIYGGVGLGSFFALAAAEQVITERLLGDFDARSWKGAAGAFGAIIIAWIARKVVASRRK